MENPRTFPNPDRIGDNPKTANEIFGKKIENGQTVKNSQFIEIDQLNELSLQNPDRIGEIPKNSQLFGKNKNLFEVAQSNEKLTILDYKELEEERRRMEERLGREKEGRRRMILNDLHIKNYVSVESLWILKEIC